MAKDFELQIDMAKLDRAIREYPGTMSQWLWGITQDVVNDVKLSFGSGPPGRTYQRGSRTHTASSPNYPPNVDEGALRASIRGRRVEFLHYRVYDGVVYGKALEDGVPGRMLARPFMQPAIRRKRRAFQRGEGLDLE